MTASLLDEVAAAPDDPPSGDDPFAAATLETEDETPRRTRRKYTRRPKVDEEGNPVTPTPRQPRNAKLADELLEGYVSLASDISAVAPTVSGVLIARAEQNIDGLMSLASGHKRTTAILRKVGKASKAAELVQSLLLLVVAAAVDFGRIPSESPLLDRIGFAELIRDERGKPKKDDQGKFVKDRKTLRDIYDTMHPHEQRFEAPAPPVMPHWNGATVDMPGSPATGTGPLRPPPPMNWTPR